MGVSKLLEKTCEEPDEPTSNPWSRVKCVFCLQTLLPSYEPKLMECLHAACASCINSKLQDQEQADGDVIGKLNNVTRIFANFFFNTNDAY